MPHSAQPQHTNHWAPRTRKRHQQEHRPQRPTERSDPTQHAKGRTGDRPGPHPPPPLLPMFEADSQHFASAPSVPRGFKLQEFWPAFTGTIGGPSEEGGGVPAKPPPLPRHPWAQLVTQPKRAHFSASAQRTCAPARPGPRRCGAPRPALPQEATREPIRPAMH